MERALSAAAHNTVVANCSSKVQSYVNQATASVFSVAFLLLETHFKGNRHNFAPSGLVKLVVAKKVFSTLI